MRSLAAAFCVFILSGLLGKDVLAQPIKCPFECQARYVRLFLSTLAKRSEPTMADYFSLFEEPEGPEGLRLFNIKKSELKNDMHDHQSLEEITLAGDAFDEVVKRDKFSESFYLTCLKKRYANRLPSQSVNLVRSFDVSRKFTVITLSKQKLRWRFLFSDNEPKPDSIIASNGVTLGDMDEDPCITPTQQKVKRYEDAPP